jgi:SpoIIAA-like
MAIELAEKGGGKILEVRTINRLTHADYQECVAEFERLLQRHGKLRVLYDLANFHGWDAFALWDEIKFDVKHFSDIERMALVGDTTWKKWLAEFCKPFAAATVRYFEHDQIEAARAWLNRSLESHEHSAVSWSPSPNLFNEKKNKGVLSWQLK